MPKPHTDRATLQNPPRDSAQHSTSAQPQSASVLTATTLEDRPTPAASLSRSPPDNDAFAFGALDASFLIRLVHDLQGPVRALTDVPTWLVEDIAEAGLQLPDGCDRLLPLLEENVQGIQAILAGLKRWILAAQRVPECSGCRLGEVLTDLGGPSGLKLELTNPNLVLPVDPADLRDVLTAAIDNSVRFHPRGSPHVWIKGDLTDRSWRLDVRDDGPGPPVLLADRLFRPLERADVNGCPAGAGFGLAIIAEIAARHDGTVSLSQLPQGRGAELCVSGPV